MAAARDDEEEEEERAAVPAAAAAGVAAPLDVAAVAAAAVAAALTAALLCCPVCVGMLSVCVRVRVRCSAVRLSVGWAGRFFFGRSQRLPAAMRCDDDGCPISRSAKRTSDTNTQTATALSRNTASNERVGRWKGDNRDTGPVGQRSAAMGRFLAVTSLLVVLRHCDWRAVSVAIRTDV
jgi:hypothetical protein